MSTKSPQMSPTTKDILLKIRKMVPPMLEKFHKGDVTILYIELRLTNVGQMGRVAVIGGSEDYTGAPYFSAMASAKLGADMVGAHFSTPPLALTILEPCYLRTPSCTGHQDLLSEPHGPPSHATVLSRQHFRNVLLDRQEGDRNATPSSRLGNRSGPGTRSTHARYVRQCDRGCEEAEYTGRARRGRPKPSPGTPRASSRI